MEGAFMCDEWLRREFWLKVGKSWKLVRRKFLIGMEVESSILNVSKFWLKALGELSKVLRRAATSEVIASC